MKFPKTVIIAVILSLILAAAILPAVEAHELQSVKVYNVWARQAAAMPMVEATMEAEMSHGEGMEGMAVSAVYMQIENPNEEALYLVGAAADVAEAVEIHEVKMENDVMQMSPIEQLEIPAGEAVTLQPGGYHVMLIGLRQSLEVGDAFPVTLTFDTGDDHPMEVVTAALVLEEAPPESSLIVANGWVRAAVGGQGAVSAAYMIIENRGEEDDRLVTVAADFAQAVELHEVKMENDVMQMSPVDGIDIPAGEENAVTLQPGGYHVMLIGVEQDLEVGQAVVLTLSFDSGAEITLALPIKAAEEMPAEHSD